jgi:hypothetical protein
VANKRRSNEELKEIDAVVERLREFLRLNYMTGAEVAPPNGRKRYDSLFVAAGWKQTIESGANPCVFKIRYRLNLAPA